MGTINVWRLITHHEDPEGMLHWAKKTGRLAIGWGHIGNIKDNGYTSPGDISTAIKEYYPELHNAGHGGGSLYHFCYIVQPGDLAILGKNGKRYLVMEVEGGYEFNSTSEKPPIGDYYHQRKASVLPIDADTLWQVAGATPAEGHNFYWTFCKLQKPIDEAMKAELAG
jgi:predicted Mrr-cat superfamily restriction endonuclease